MRNADCYNTLASVYDLIFEDWQVSIDRQANSLRAILQNCSIKPPARILDCACGIGTQSLGLSSAGFDVVGSDISEQAVQRARQESSRRGLHTEFHVADMLDLTLLGDMFDAVICMDNSISHLTTRDELVRTAGQIQAKLRPGGVFMASIRDYDAHPVIQGPSFYGSDETRRIVFQLWDWLDESRYIFHLYITRRVAEGWNTVHSAGLYRALQRNEVDSVLAQSKFTSIHWLLPSETGFYQPIVLARKP